MEDENLKLPLGTTDNKSPGFDSVKPSELERRENCLSKNSLGNTGGDGSASLISVYVTVEQNELELHSIDKGNCMDLEDLAHELSVLWTKSRTELKEFLKKNNNEDIELAEELDKVCLLKPWPFFEIHYFSEDASGNLIEMDFFKDGSADFDVYGKEEEEWPVATGEWFLSNVVRVNFVRR